MLLLEGLRSTVLTYKLVIHLLDYACPLKTSLPMSLDLLLYFMTNCTLALDSKVSGQHDTSVMFPSVTLQKQAAASTSNY